MPGITQHEFDLLLADTSKAISADIQWGDDEDHSPAVEFMVKVENDDGHPLVLRGSYNHDSQSLSFVLIHRSAGRIYALDMGKRHRNPSDGKLLATCINTNGPQSIAIRRRTNRKILQSQFQIRLVFGRSFAKKRSSFITVNSTRLFQKRGYSMVANPCELIAAGIGELYQCEQFNEYVRIRTPFLYPDGDFIDLFLRDDGQFHTLTDLGETTRWLRMQTASAKRTAKQTSLIEDICRTLGVNFYRGALNARITSQATFAEEMNRLAQACVRVSDLWFTFRTRAVESVTEEVSAFLMENRVPFEPNEKHQGRSGRPWVVDFHTFGPSRNTFIQVLTTSAKGASHRLSEHVLAQWVDLSHLAAGTAPLKFVSLFDDTTDVWNEEDLKLLSGVSDVHLWSKPQDVLNVVAT